MCADIILLQMLTNHIAMYILKFSIYTYIVFSKNVYIISNNREPRDVVFGIATLISGQSVVFP